MSIDVKQMAIFCALVLVILAGLAAVLLSILVKNPSEDLRDGIRTLYFIMNLGAAAIIGFAGASAG